jgi:hypothetical protein
VEGRYRGICGLLRGIRNADNQSTRLICDSLAASSESIGFFWLPGHAHAFGFQGVPALEASQYRLLGETDLISSGQLTPDVLRTKDLLALLT